MRGASDDLDPLHESAVDDFMRKQFESETGITDDKPYGDWLNRHGILTEEQLSWRRSREIGLTEKFENTLSLSADMYGRRCALPRM